MSESLDKSHLVASSKPPRRDVKPAVRPSVDVSTALSSNHISAEGQTNGAVTRGAQSRRLGSKANEGTWKTIINQMPPHRTYIEPFLGWGAIMLNKAPAAHSICIDREAEKVKNFLLELTTAQPTIGSGIVNEADAMWSTIGASGAAISQMVSNGKDAETIVHRALLVVANALPFLARYPWRGDELVYLDPPYLHETRSSRHRYMFEMDTLEHQALLDIIKKIPANVMISGYKSKLYAKALKRWRLVTFEAITRGGTTRTEHLWCNFPEPVELHDYRWVGETFRQRQDQRRMRSRWLGKLEKMSTLKRQALFAAIQEFHQQKNQLIDEDRCPCGCGLRLTGKKRAATAACRKRLERLKALH